MKIEYCRENLAHRLFNEQVKLNTNNHVVHAKNYLLTRAQVARARNLSQQMLLSRH